MFHFLNMFKFFENLKSAKLVTIYVIVFELELLESPGIYSEILQTKLIKIIQIQ